MTTRFFPAAITQASDGGYTIQVVDVPGTISQGETLEETIVNGEEALALALEMYAAEGRDIPSASDLKAAAGKLDAAERRELVTMQMIRGAMPEPAVRINITLPGDLLKRIDTAAGSYGRSGWIANAARKSLSELAASIQVKSSPRLVPDILRSRRADAAGKKSKNVPRKRA